MDSADSYPLVFANRVIRQYLDHSMGPDVVLLARDYFVIRLVFRRLGGSWERLEHGDIVHNRLLSKVLGIWSASRAKGQTQVEAA